MSTISGISNITHTLHFQAQGSQETQASFQDTLDEVDKTGRKDAVDNAHEKSSKEKFKDLMDMSIGERYLELYLKSEGLTKEEFEALPPEEQEKIIAKFQEEMEARMNGGKIGTSLL